MFGIFNFCGYDSDSYGEDIAETESDESTDYDTEDEYDSDFIDDDLDMYPTSPILNSGGIALRPFIYIHMNPSTLQNLGF